MIHLVAADPEANARSQKGALAVPWCLRCEAAPALDGGQCWACLNPCVVPGCRNIRLKNHPRCHKHHHRMRYAERAARGKG